MSDQTVINKDVGYFSTETGAQELLSKLFKEKEPNPPSQHVPHEFLGDSLRENRIEAKADPVEFKGIRIKGWVIGSNKSHITPLDLLDKIGEDANLTPPEMVFGNNQLIFYHEPSGVCYNFLAVEALKGAHFAPPASNEAADIIVNQQLKVSAAKHNTNKEDVKELNITYDWTYSTDYKGTLQRIKRSLNDLAASNTPLFTRTLDVKYIPTEDRIDIEKVKQREPILWYDEVNLYEDELHDHGISIMSIKVRVMPSGFYVLARYWLRLDHVVVRLHETRIHHLFGSDHMIREYTRKEEQFATLFDAGHPRNMSNYTNIDTFQHLLPIQEALYEKIYIE